MIVSQPGKIHGMNMAAGEVLCFRLLKPGKVGLSSIEQASAEGGVSWIHLEGGSREAMIRMAVERIGLSEHLVLRALDPAQTQRITCRESTVAFSVAWPVMGSDAAQTEFVGILGRGDLLVTLSPQPLQDIRDLLEDWVDDPEGIGQTAPELLHTLLDAAVDSFFPCVDRIHDRTEALEDEVFEQKNYDPAAALCIKRELLEVRRAIGPLRDSINALIRHGDPWVPRSMVADYQDVSSHVLRVTESLDMARDILSTIMDAQLSVASNRLNEVMKVLTVISTLMMVCSLVAGIYGMNFRHMPELEWEYGYPFALGIMSALCVGILWLYRRKGWF